ncbi:MAG: PH domain-containing protein [Patescibacteria group bacterium]
MWLGKVLPSPLPGEHIIFFLRRHQFTFHIQLVIHLLFLITPLLLAWIFINYLPEQWQALFNGALTEVFIKMAASIYYLGVWVFFWTAWVDYYLDVWLVTNERIISVEQKGLFNRLRSELRLSRVEDVTTEVRGILPTVLHFGDITIQTAGMEQNAVFKSVPQPYKVAERIIKISNNWRKIHPHSEAAEHMHKF